MQSTQGPPGNRGRETHTAVKAAGSAPLSPTFLTVKTTAEALEVSRLTVYRRFHAGLLPGRKIGRSIKISAAFVNDLLAALKAGPVDVDDFAAQWLAKASGGAA